MEKWLAVLGITQCYAWVGDYILAGILMMIWCFLYGQTLFPILFCIFLFLFGTTLIWPNSFAGAFTPFDTIAGCAETVYSFMQLGRGVIIGWISSFLPTDYPYSLPIIFILTSTTSWFIFERTVRKNNS
jgi:DHA1 family bicyclomycin/chloramphenicol resistance-like MFS transporter/DHA1 family 2-module integral membrane pump EmrD-like MFS transporter